MKGFRGLRILILLFILVLVAGTTWLGNQRVSEWRQPLWVYLYPSAAVDQADLRTHVRQLDTDDFSDLEQFFSRQGQRYGISAEPPIQVHVVEAPLQAPPPLPRGGNPLQVAWWSLQMRWYAWRAESGADRPDPDIQLFLRYHPDRGGQVLDISAAVKQGRFGIVNLFTGRRATATNQVVIAHELLHTLGATDKYDRATNLPLAPDGLAEPARQPLYPQRWAEIMGGRIALSAQSARIPNSLRQALIGPATAREIGMLD